MLISQIKAKYLAEATRRLEAQTKRGVTPTGSRLGTCAAQLQMLQFPDVTHPTAFPPRSLMMFDEGDRGEDWFRKEVREAVKGHWGLEQQPFHFPVPLDGALITRLRAKGHVEWGKPGRLDVVEIPGFSPAGVSMITKGRYRFRQISSPLATPVTAKGFMRTPLVLDAEARLVWVPVRVDGVVLHDLVGLAIAEIKSMSNFAFRAACLGQISYGNRCQMAAARVATGLNVVWFVYRKETFHTAEIAVEGGERKNVRVVIERLNGQQEAFLASLVGEDEAPEVTAETTGAAATLPGDDLWDQAQVVAPFDPRLIAEIRERIRRVIATDGTAWDREYGPSFVCKTCGGTGQQTLQKRGGEALKKPKPCPDCETRGWVMETTLPRFPCGYCPVVGFCWPMAQLRIEGDKPFHYVTKTAIEEAGLTFTKPAGY